MHYKKRILHHYIRIYKEIDEIYNISAIHNLQVTIQISHQIFILQLDKLSAI